MLWSVWLVVALSAVANAVVLSSCAAANADCTVLSVDSLLLSVDAAQGLNLSSPLYGATCTGGGAAFTATADKCEGALANATFQKRQAVLHCNFATPTSNTTSNATANLTLSVHLAFVFQESALYTATGTVACRGGSVSLTNISLSGLVDGKLVAGPVAVPSGTFQASTNTSFSCPQTSFVFAVRGNGTLVFDGVRAEAFLANSTLGPADSNVVCSASPAEDKSSKETRAGLIVGSIISALALIGIIAFAYSKCRAKSNYELLNSTH